MIFGFTPEPPQSHTWEKDNAESYAGRCLCCCALGSVNAEDTGVGGCELELHESILEGFSQLKDQQ